AHPHPPGGRAGFFVPVSSLLRDAFFLAYGGLHWGYQDVLALSIRRRQEFVEALEKQLEFERHELEKRPR
ncbi:MAG TPA: hypothetical protein PLE19_23800, partial [Planctomycetota bacterium]|nr:hypothetical protein [Planctomycetota bacterium]